MTAIGRRKLGISHAKLKEVLHPDFADCSVLAEELAGQDAAIVCLGTDTGSVPGAELRTITVAYTIEFARVLRLSSPDAAFSFLKREWRGFEGTKSHSLRTLQGRGREGATRDEILFSTRLPSDFRVVRKNNTQVSL